MQSFTDLEAWKCGMDLVKEVYILTRKFPSDERFGLTSQIRKSSTSIVLNLAEGFGRVTSADKANKYTIARGECSETEASLRIAIHIGYLTKQETENALAFAQRTGRLLSGLISAFEP